MPSGERPQRVKASVLAISTTWSGPRSSIMAAGAFDDAVRDVLLEPVAREVSVAALGRDDARAPRPHYSSLQGAAP
jgi:hypothetical protein